MSTDAADDAAAAAAADCFPCRDARKLSAAPPRSSLHAGVEYSAAELAYHAAQDAAAPKRPKRPNTP